MRKPTHKTNSNRFKFLDFWPDLSIITNLTSVPKYRRAEVTAIWEDTAPDIYDRILVDSVGYETVLIRLGWNSNPGEITIWDARKSFDDDRMKPVFVNFDSNGMEIPVYGDFNDFQYFITMTEIEIEAFAKCYISEIIIPKGIQKIGRAAFYGPGVNLVKALFMPGEGVLEIGSYAFSNAFKLAVNAYGLVKLPVRTTKIGDFAFSDNMFSGEFVIPENVNYIGQRVFDNCVNLESIRFNGVGEINLQPNSFDGLDDVIFYVDAASDYKEKLQNICNIPSNRIIEFGDNLNSERFDIYLFTDGSYGQDGNTNMLGSIHGKYQSVVANSVVKARAPFEYLGRNNEFVYSGYSVYPSSLDITYINNDGQWEIHIGDIDTNTIVNNQHRVGINLNYQQRPGLERLVYQVVEPLGTVYAYTFGVKPGDPIIVPEQTPKITQGIPSIRKYSDYLFTGWELPEVTIMPNNDLTITGRFVLKESYTLTYMNEGSTYATQTYLVGDTITPPSSNPTKAHHAFSGWLNMPQDMLMPGNDLTVTAQFTEDPKYTLTYMSEGSTYTTQQYYDGDTITPPSSNPTKVHHQFTGWQNMPQDMLMPSNNLTVTAQFTEDPKYTVTYEYE